MYPGALSSPWPPRAPASNFAYHLFIKPSTGGFAAFLFYLLAQSQLQQGFSSCTLPCTDRARG